MKRRCVLRGQMVGCVKAKKAKAVYEAGLATYLNYQIFVALELLCI